MSSMDINTAPKIKLDLNISYKIMAQAVSAGARQNFSLKKKDKTGCEIWLW